MSVKRRSKVLCQRAVPYELYKGLAFTTIWLESTDSQKKMLEGSVLCRAFLFAEICMEVTSDGFVPAGKGEKNTDENSCRLYRFIYIALVHGI